MEKNISGLLIVFAAIFLVSVGLSYSTGYNAGNEDTKIITEIEYQNVSVLEIEYLSLPSQLDLAVEAFLNAVEAEEDEDGNSVDVLDNLNGKFYFDELEVRSVDEDYSIFVTGNGDVTTIVFSIDLRFDDGDDREKESYKVEVVFEEDEDTMVTILE